MNETPADDSQRLHDQANMFEQDWLRGGRPRIESYLDAVGDDVDQCDLLQYLLTIELDMRWALGETPQLEEYAIRFAEFPECVRATFQQRDGMAVAPTADARLLGTALGEGLLNLQQALTLLLAMQQDDSRPLRERLTEDGMLSDTQCRRLVEESLSTLPQGHERELIEEALRRVQSRGSQQISAEQPTPSVRRVGVTCQPSTVAHPPNNSDRAATRRDRVEEVGFSTLFRNLSCASSPNREDQLGRFVVRDEIGRGGLGRVWRAIDPHLGREVALKEMLAPAGTEEQSRRFCEEAQITGQLEHPNIVPIYELTSEADGRPFYAMRLLEGRTYVQAIKEYHRLAPRDLRRRQLLNELLRAFVCICQAVGYAHSRHVLHRDLKPANVLLGDFGQVLVADWGLAKLLDHPNKKTQGSGTDSVDSTAATTPAASGSVKIPTDVRHAATSAGSVLGTPSYMSPEQARGQLDQLDARADIFSLGAILFEALVGRRPYVGADQDEVLAKAKTGQFPRPRSIRPAVPAALEAICLKAMAIEPGDRYASAGELAGEILSWQSGDAVAAYPEPWYEQAARWARRHRTFCLGAAATLTAVAVTLGLWSLQERGRTNALRAASRPLLLEGQAALSTRRLETARLKLSQAVAKVGQEKALRDIRHDAERLLAETRAAIQRQSSRNIAMQRLQQFRAQREEAMFHAALLDGHDLPTSLNRAGQAAQQGLALFVVNSRKPHLPAFNPEDGYSQAEHQEIRSGCGELLLVLVETLAQPLPGEEPVERQRRGQEALALLDAAGNMQLSPGAELLQRCKSLQLLGRDNEATEHWRQLPQTISATSATDQFFVGMESFYREDYRSALARFHAALQLSPDAFWPQYLLAVCCLKQSPTDASAPQRAIAHLSACAYRRPRFAWSYLLRGVAYGQIGNFSAADADFEKAEALGIEPYALLVNRGTTQIRRNQITGAIDDLKRAIHIDPQRYQAYIDLAGAYRGQRQFDSAIRWLDKLLAQRPRLALAHRNRAYVVLEQGNLARALEDLNRAAGLEDPESAQQARTQLDRGHVLLQLGRVEQARAALQAARRASNAVLAWELHTAEAYHVRALALLRLSELQDSVDGAYNLRQVASQDLDQAIELSRLKTSSQSFRGQVHQQRGLLRAVLGDLPGAMQDYAHAVAMLPIENGELQKRSMARLHARRGWSYLNNGPQLALADFEQALRLQPQSADALNGRGYARVVAGDYQQAVADAEQAVTLALQDLTTSTNRQAVNGLLSNAACVYAVASGQRTDNQGRGVGIPSKLAEKYARRAIELLRKSVELTPAAQRAAFLGAVLSDRALDPIRSRPEFQAIERIDDTTFRAMPLK